MFPSPKLTLLGTLIDNRYRIISQLGYGYYGETYLAQDTRRMGRQCVIKRLQLAIDNSSRLQDAKHLFESEARILEKLGREHDQIPDLLDYFQVDQEFYLVQELVEGYPLSAVLATGQRLPEAEVIDILLNVLGILSYVHQAQVIHRDIKPSNLMRRYQDGKIVLIDFGAVKQVHTSSSEPQGKITPTRIIGTPGYMPSEQAKGKPRFSSDIYALGMTAIEALTGYHPNQLQENADGEIVWQDEAQVSPELAAIINKMTRSHLSDRYQSAEQALHDLQQLQSVNNSYKPRFWLAKPKRRRALNLKNTLLVSGTIICLALLATQAFAFWRFGVFPARLIAVLNAIPSSFFLQRSFSAHSGDVHPVPLSVNGQNFVNFNSVAVSQDGQILATGSGDGAIKIWNPSNGEFIRLLTGHSGHVHAVALTPDGQILASGSGDATIKLWNPQTGKLLRTLSGNLGHVNTVAISPDGQILASGGMNQQIKLWNLNTGKLLSTLQGHSGDVNSLAINACQQPILASGSADGTIKLWNLNTGQLVRTFNGAGNVFSVALNSCQSPTPPIIASGAADGNIKLWNFETGQLLRTLGGHSHAVTAVAISPDGKTLSSNASNQIIKLWNLEGQPLRTFIGYIPTTAEFINSVAFSPDSTTLVSSTGDGTINFWRVP